MHTICTYEWAISTSRLCWFFLLDFIPTLYPFLFDYVRLYFDFNVIATIFLKTSWSFMVEIGECSNHTYNNQIVNFERNQFSPWKSLSLPCSVLLKVQSDFLLKAIVREKGDFYQLFKLLPNLKQILKKNYGLKNSIHYIIDLQFAKKLPTSQFSTSTTPTSNTKRNLCNKIKYFIRNFSKSLIKK